MKRIFIASTLVFLLSILFACKPGNTAWQHNSLHGVSFETPGEVREIKTELSAEYLKEIKEYKTYMLEHGNLVVFFLAVDSRFIGYNKEVGLSNSVGNMVQAMKGSDIQLDYTDPVNNLDDLACTGTFMLNGSRMHVRSYVYWDQKGKFFILTTFGQEADIETMDRIQKSFTVPQPV